MRDDSSSSEMYGLSALVLVADVSLSVEEEVVLMNNCVAVAAAAAVGDLILLILVPVPVPVLARVKEDTRTWLSREKKDKDNKQQVLRNEVEMEVFIVVL